MEVPARGKGCVAVDPTPSGGRARDEWTANVLADLFPGEEPKELENEIASSSEDKAEREEPEEEEDANNAAATLKESDLRLGQVSILLFASILAVAIGLFNLHYRKKRNEGTRYGDGKDDDYRRLLRLLAGLGFKKQCSQTPLEFAELVVQIGGEEFHPLIHLTWMRYQTHFGGGPEPRDY